VVVPEDQLSLAIGRDGQNARLAAKLTGWRIDIKSQVEAAGESLQKLHEDPNYQEMAANEAEAMENIAVMLEKKAEGRPLPPEDYNFMASFIDRVERKVEKHRRAEDLEAKRRYEEALATVPELTFEIDILDVDLKEHILYILQEAGIDTLGDLILQMRLDSDRILALNGIGPKSFEEISELTDALRVEPAEQQPMAEPSQEETLQTEEIPTEELEPEALPEVLEEAETVETPQEEVVESEAEEEPPAEKETVKEEKEFDKLFSYDAKKYGYYKPEPIKSDEEEEEPQKPGKKKKRKKRRPLSEERDDWEEW
jgi:N utilization substance protein A